MKKLSFFGGFLAAPLLLLTFLMVASVGGAGCGSGEECDFIIKDDSLPDGVVGAAYSFNVDWNASGCVWKNDTENIIWTHSAGTLPPGISFNSNGELRGTPSAAGVFNLTFKVTYQGETDFSEVQKGFSLTVRE